MEDELLYKLTFHIRVKTIKLKKIKKEKDELIVILSQLKILVFIVYISSFLILYNNDTYIEYFTNILNTMYKFRISFPFLGLPYIIILLLLLFICITFTIYYIRLLQKKEKSEKQYNKIRLEIIESIKSTNFEFCTHNRGCNCKEEYYKKMDKFNIDIVFK